MSYQLTLTFEITTNPTTVTIPITYTGTLGIVMDWGDNTTSSSTLSHTYTGTGIRIVGINGYTLTNNAVTAFGGVSWAGVQQLKSIESTDAYWGLGTGVTNMYGLFKGATNLLTSVPNHFPPSVTNINSMFINSTCSPNISNWNVSNVTTMQHTFRSSTFSGDISGWDVSSVTDMSYMFYYSDFNGDITRWDVRNVTRMEYMFQNATAFNRDIRGWFVKETAYLYKMFYGSAMDVAFGGTPGYNSSLMYSNTPTFEFFNNITVLYRDDTITEDAYNFDIERPGNVDVGYIMNGTDIGHVFTSGTGNFINTTPSAGVPSTWTMENYYVTGKYMTNGTSLTERFASSIKRLFVVCTVPPTFDTTYVYYKFVDEVGGAEYTNTFRLITTNDIYEVLAPVLCVGGGGGGGNDGGNWGSGGGGAGTVQIGQTYIATGSNDYTIHVGSRGTNNESTKNNGASWITRTVTDSIQVRSEQGGRGYDFGNTGTNHGGSTGGGSRVVRNSIVPDADSDATTTRNTYTNFTRYVKRGGISYGEGGGGGGGAAADGGAANGWEGGGGGAGVHWTVNGQYYGGGGAGQGVWDKANGNGPAAGGGGSGGGAGTNGTGGGGSAAQSPHHDNNGAGGGAGGSGVVIIAIPKTALAIPTPYQLLVWTTGSSYSTTSGIPAHVTSNAGYTLESPVVHTFEWHYGPTYALVLCVGGGGGGGAALGYEGGGGGGGGTVSIGYISLTKYSTYSITVGSGTTSNSTSGYQSEIKKNTTTTLIQSRGGGRGGQRGGANSDFSTSGWPGGDGGSGGGSGGAAWAYGYNGGDMGGANLQSYDNFSMYCSPGSGGYYNNYAGAGGGGAGVHPSNPVEYVPLSAAGGYHWGGGGGGDGIEWEIDGNMYGGGGGGGGAANQIGFAGYGGPPGAGGGGRGDGWDVGGTGGTWGTGGGGGGGMTPTIHGNAQAQGRIGGGGIVIFALIR